MIPTGQQREIPYHLKAMQLQLSPGVCPLKVPLRQESFDSIPFPLSFMKSGEETSKPEVLRCGDKSVSPLDTWHSELSVEDEATSPQGIFHSSRLATPLQWGFRVFRSHSLLSVCVHWHTHKTAEKSTRCIGVSAGP